MDSTQRLYDPLYCEEQHWEEQVEEADPLYLDLDYEVNDMKQNPLVSLEQDLFWEEQELHCLLSKQEPNGLYNTIKNNPFLATARREAVDWILSVTSHYSFSPITPVLAVNYFDRFVFRFEFQKEKPWMTQLTAVACLSLAAKVEETQVPLLLDLQVEEAKYVFEAKTIQRMEVLVLSTLKWKMNPVTPLSFLDYFTRRLGLKHHLSVELLRRCQSLLLSLISDSRFLCCVPSVMATATMLHVINNVEPCIGVQYQNQLSGILGIDKELVDNCGGLICELTSRVYGNNKRKFGSIPGSPNGVMDFTFSSDSSNESWATTASASVSSSPEPPSKKMALPYHASADVLCIPR